MEKTVFFPYRDWKSVFWVTLFSEKKSRFIIALTIVDFRSNSYTTMNRLKMYKVLFTLATTATIDATRKMHKFVEVIWESR